MHISTSLFGWLVADGWCWFVLREEYCWLVAGGWFVVREKYCWLVADKPSEQRELLICDLLTFDRSLGFVVWCHVSPSQIICIGRYISHVFM
jgi:hypothetical protein